MALAALVAGSLVVAASLLDSNAGWPRGLADLEGHWALDEVRGTFEVPPPDSLTFGPGPAPNLVRISDGTRGADFVVQGGGRFVFDGSQHFEPLLPAGSTEVFTMTHLRPALPAWDHLIFFPDGMPIGPDANRRSIRYERE
ncbi:MAG TPA: hypothetical protein VFY71_16590 [Planctomycetota bacterium]|nr:hypothetical protein [Planctomycetota bacterium]